MKGKYDECLNYIKKYWDKGEFFLPKDKGLHIGLPHAFISPNRTKFKGDLFYWDTYFTNLGLLELGKVELAKNHVDNFVYLFMRFGVIPARNKFSDLGLSQPPFLTSMILDVYKYTKDKNWLREVSRIAELEYKDYWMSKKRYGSKGHLIFKGLSRYCDHLGLDLPSEHESGWDMTSRYKSECLEYLSVDLNSLLYKYESDFQKIYTILKLDFKVEKYRDLASKRKAEMITLMWSEKRGLFFDYNHSKQLRSKFYSLASFFPMWAGIATKEQAKKIVKNLKVFEYAGGLANTQKDGLSEKFKQWDYPNGWPGLHWIVIKGLLDYGYKKDALRIAKKWLDLNRRVFKKTGKFWEKYDVVHSNVGKSGRYSTQTGFGWTNGVFVKLVKMLERQ